jgi:hypothetical protein
LLKFFAQKGKLKFCVRGFNKDCILKLNDVNDYMNPMIENQSPLVKALENVLARGQGPPKVSLTEEDDDLFEPVNLDRYYYLETEKDPGTKEGPRFIYFNPIGRKKFEHGETMIFKNRG